MSKDFVFYWCLLWGICLFTSNVAVLHGILICTLQKIENCRSCRAAFGSEAKFRADYVSQFRTSPPYNELSPKHEHSQNLAL